MNLYSLRRIYKGYTLPERGHLTILSDFNGEIPLKPLTALIGRSGCGKTTLLNLLGGLDKPDMGHVQFKGMPVHGCKAGKGSVKPAYVFQDLNLINHLTVVQNIALSGLAEGMSWREAIGRAKKCLSDFGLHDLGKKLPSRLSGGERQRVALLRALSSGANVILADEPTGNLDPDTARGIMAYLQRFAESLDIPIVMVTHDHNLADEYCDQVFEVRKNCLAQRPRRINHTVIPQGVPSHTQSQADLRGAA